MMNAIKKYFGFEERGTNLRTEILAGVTTFLSMAYILVVNPALFSEGGVPFSGCYIATILASALACMVMGAVSNYPISIAPGLGINAYLVYTVIIAQHHSWQEALGAACVASGLFILISITSFRQLFVDSIPKSLKAGITVGIGLFVSLIGMKQGHLLVANPNTFTGIGPLSDPTMCFTLFGLFITMILIVRKVWGAIFWGLVLMTITSLCMGYMSFPEKPLTWPSGFSETAFQLSFDNLLETTDVIITLLLVTLFDTTGTLIGVGKQAGIIRDNHFPNLQSALMADSVGSFFGSFLGTGPLSSFVESGTGVAAGGRTGLATIVTGVLFLVMLFFQPVIEMLAHQGAIAAPALILVGMFMMADVVEIDWHDMEEAIPAFFTIMITPLGFSIAIGVGVGLLIYAFLKIAAGKWREVHPMLYFITLLLMAGILL